MQRFFEQQLGRVTQLSISARHHWRLLLVRGLLTTSAIVLVVLFGKMLEGDIVAIENWMRDQGAWMAVTFSVIFLVAVLLCLPADIFVFIGGTLFGLGWGFLLAAVVEWVAMALQFYLARSLFKTRIESFLAKHARFRAIDNAISRQGFRIAFLLRLGPVPFSPLSYALSVSGISFRTYMLASLGMLPTLFPVVYYGMVAQHLTKLATGTENDGWVHYTTMIVSVVVFIFVTAYITRVASKALKEANAF